MPPSFVHRIDRKQRQRGEKNAVISDCVLVKEGGGGRGAWRNFSGLDGALTARKCLEATAQDLLFVVGL